MANLKYIELPERKAVEIRRSMDNELVGFIRKNKTSGLVEVGFYSFTVMTSAQSEELQQNLRRFTRKVNPPQRSLSGLPPRFPTQ